MSVLEDFRALGVPTEGSPPPRGRAKKTARAPWAPLAPERLGYGLLVAWDQTVRNAGWVVLRNRPERDAPEVLAAGTCRTKAGEQRGWETTLADSVSIALQIEAIVVECHGWGEGLAVVHEAPPSGGGQLSRPESSVLASHAVRMAAHRAGLPCLMVSNQAGKLLATGDRRAKKPAIKVAVEAMTWVDGVGALRNEHERDALLVGLKVLELRGERA